LDMTGTKYLAPVILEEHVGSNLCRGHVWA